MLLIKPHCWKSSFFVQKFNFDFPRKLSIFFRVKNSWKCCGFGLFSCWQFWFPEKNCQKKIWVKNSRRFWGFVKTEFLDIFEYFIFKESGISACWNDCSSLGQSWISYIRPDSARKIGGLVHDFQFHIDGKSQVCISLGSHFRLLVISNVFFFTPIKDEGELSQR